MTSLPPPCRALGAELAAARAARGLTEDAMAARLMLSKRQLVSLEQAELTGFYGLTYFRMALRKYMVAMEMPLERLDRIDWSEAAPESGASAGDDGGHIVAFDDDSTRSRLPAAAAVLLVVISAAGYTFWTSRAERSPVPAPTDVVADQPSSPVPVPESVPQASPVPEPPPPPGEVAGLAPAASATPSPDTDVPPAPTEPVSVRAQNQDSLLQGVHVTVASTTWVFARFEDNSTMERGVAGGASLELEGYPVYLAVGSADDVNLVVDGRRVPLTPYARNGQIRLSRQALATLRP